MPHAAKLGQILSAISGLFGYFAFTGYLFGISRVFRIEAVTAMSAHAAVGLLLVSPAHWFARPEYGFARSFIQGVASGRIIRRLIPAAICVPLLCGGLVQLGEQMEWFSSRFGETLVTLYTAVAFTGLGFWLVGVLERQQEERRGYERSLGRTGRALDRKKRELEQFAFTVSHDLKSPLVSVRGFIGLMLKDIKDGDYVAAEDSATEVSAAAAEMNDIIDGILAYSRVGRIDEEAQEVDVVELVDAIVELHEGRRAEHEIDVVIDRTMPSVYGFKTSLRRALENLYVNALRYAAKSDKPRIEVGGFSIDDKCQYYVKDNGPGIAPEYHDKVFELFQRLDVSEPGTGLGLASVAKIAELHQGRAFVDSKPGHGATFILEVARNGAELLLVEDDDRHAKLVIRCLDQHRIGNSVDRVVDGEQALTYLRKQGEYAKARRPDVILLDLNLPKVDGLEVLKTIKADESLSLIPVVMLTTSQQESDRLKAYKLNVNSYVVKPVDFEKFLQMVSDCSFYWGVWNQPAQSPETSA